MSPKKNIRLHVKMVCPPMLVHPKYGPEVLTSSLRPALWRAALELKEVRQDDGPHPTSDRVRDHDAASDEDGYRRGDAEHHVEDEPKAMLLVTAIIKA